MQQITDFFLRLQSEPWKERENNVHFKPGRIFIPKNLSIRVSKTSVQILGLLFASCVISGKLLNFSEPIYYLQNEDENSTYFNGLLWGFSERMHDIIAQSLAHNEHTIHFHYNLRRNLLKISNEQQRNQIGMIGPRLCFFGWCEACVVSKQVAGPIFQSINPDDDCVKVRVWLVFPHQTATSEWRENRTQDRQVSMLTC